MLITKRVLIAVLTVVFCLNTFGSEKYTMAGVVKAGGCYDQYAWYIPTKINVDSNDPQILRLTMIDQTFCLFRLTGAGEFNYQQYPTGIFVNYLKPELANRAALFMDLSTRPLGSGGTDGLCCYFRYPGSPVGYYLNPVKEEDRVYKRSIIFQGLRCEVSVVFTQDRLRLTLVDENNPCNFIQIYFRVDQIPETQPFPEPEN